MKGRRIDVFQRLQHMMDAVEQIEEFTRGVSEAEFLSDRKLSGAVLFQFSIVGEAVVHIAPELLQQYDYPWYKVRAFRNLVAHEYFNISYAAVWQIIIRDVPVLKAAILRMLREEFPDDN